MLEKDDANEAMAERPLECGECKRSIAIIYTEIIGDVETNTCMCADCPEVQRRLYGTAAQLHIANQINPVITGANAQLVCGNCSTTLEDVKRGHRLGCAECYVVFEDILPLEMHAVHSLPNQLYPYKKGLPMHIGRTPGEMQTINIFSQILALDEVLKEMLSKENYEQAAILRDQIKNLTKNSSSASKSES